MADVVHVLIVDDDAEGRRLLTAVLEVDASNTVAQAESGAAAMSLLGREEFDVAVVDVQLPDHSGIEILRWARDAEIDAAPLSPARDASAAAGVDVQLPDHSGIEILRWARDAEIDAELIVLTGHADVETAVQAMRLGAYDFITKPCKNVELRAVVAKAAEKKALRRENSGLKAVVNRHDGLPQIGGQSAEIREVLAVISRVAASDSPVLVQGESGTGKELVARSLHLQSRRAARAVVARSD